MNPMIERSLAVAFGGALGAVSRYWISGWVSRLNQEHPFPFST
ncbi:MAG: CrcB family protein [Thermoanaerobaculales bacterium]|nr:CrcB family protein [Thermoanaerobaculales bacterium]